MKYTYNVIHIPGNEINFDILTKWLRVQEEGDYVVTIEKIVREVELFAPVKGDKKRKLVKDLTEHAVKELEEYEKKVTKDDEQE